MSVLATITGVASALAGLYSAGRSIFGKKKDSGGNDSTNYNSLAQSQSTLSNLANLGTTAYNIYNSERSYEFNKANTEAQNSRADRSLALSEESYRNGIVNSASQYAKVGINPAQALSGSSTYSGSMSGGSGVDSSSVRAPQIDTSTILALAQLKSNEKLKEKELSTSKDIADDTNSTNKDIAALNAKTSSDNNSANIESAEKIAAFNRALEYYKESHEYEKIKADINNSNRLTDAQISQIEKGLALSDAQIAKCNAEISEIEANVEKIGVERTQIQLQNIYQGLTNREKESVIDIFEQFGVPKDVYSSILEGTKVMGTSTQFLNCARLFTIATTYFGRSGFETTSSSSNNKSSDNGGGSW